MRTRSPRCSAPRLFPLRPCPPRSWRLSPLPPRRAIAPHLHSLNRRVGQLRRPRATGCPPRHHQPWSAHRPWQQVSQVSTIRSGPPLFQRPSTPGARLPRGTALVWSAIGNRQPRSSGRIVVRFARPGHPRSRSRQRRWRRHPTGAQLIPRHCSLYLEIGSGTLAWTAWQSHDSRNRPVFRPASFRFSIIVHTIHWCKLYPSPVGPGLPLQIACTSMSFLPWGGTCG